MDKYREIIKNSGLIICDERIDDLIDWAEHVSDKTGEDMEFVLNMVIAVAMFNNR